MIFQTKPNIAKQLGTVHDFGLKNLIVSGCSFSHNYHETFAISWPYYLRDLGGFEKVLSTSLPGAGNYHISNSLIWALDQERIDPQNCLVVVMWSGNDRDDFITPSTNINQYSCKFHYTDHAMSAITGGSDETSQGNTLKSTKDFFSVQTKKSRAVTNYLWILNAWNYLQNNKYKFLFLNFLDPTLPSRSQHFDIKKHLPLFAQHQLDLMIPSIIDPYSFAVSNNLLDIDNFHPNIHAHLAWTRTVLLPELQKKFS